VTPLLLTDILTRAAATAPTGTAVISGNVSLTFQELQHHAQCLATVLRQDGVQPGDRVGVCLPKNAAAVTAVYGILLAGGVYVPVDVRSPAARLTSLLTDADCRVVLTTPVVAATLGNAWPADRPLPKIVEYGPGPAIAAAETAETIADPAVMPVMTPDAPAAILYTSGSTGRSKGVVLTHANILCFANWGAGHFALQPDDRVASIAPLHFDLSTFDLYSTHLAAATVVLLDEQAVMFPAAVVATLQKQRITTCYATPTTWIQLLERGQLEKAPPGGLRRVLFAGEVFPVPLLRRLMQALPQATFTNLYGPVETNVCTAHTLREVPAEEVGEIPIGVPLPHSPVELLDDAMRPVGTGEIGQICVSGPGVTPGYWGQPGQTARSRWNGQAETYLTGDLAVRDQHGILWFRGRRDHQVKLRGHRIELGEVEQTLASHPGVLQVVAVVASGPSGDQQLVAFVQGNPSTLTEAELHRHGAEKLAIHARPHRIVVMSALPMTESGKIDRQNLQSRIVQD